MGLLHSYGLHNQVTSQALSISYTSRAAKWVASQADYLFEIHRIASKVYSFVGMDERTARACRDDKEAQYTRDLTSYRNENGAVSFRKTRVCTATIAMTHDDAGMWHVDVTVNEDQVQYGFGWELNTVYQFFDTTFDYDEPAVIPGAFVQLDRLERDARNITGHYRVDTDGFDRISGDFAVLKSADGKTWTEDAAAVKTNEGYFTTPIDGAGQFYCIAWKGLLSNSLAAFEDGYDFTGTLGPLVYVSNTCWRVTYKIDVPDFDREKVIVWLKRATDAEWQDITTDCDVRNGMIYLAKMTDARAMFAVKLYYSGNGGITTNESLTPYVPSADVGDGTIIPIAASNRSGQPGQYTFRIFFDTTIREIDTSAITTQTSDDGVTWQPLTASVDSGSIVATATDVLKFVKVFYNGTQASCGVATDTYPTDDTLYIYAADIGYGASLAAFYYASDGSIESVEVEESSDGGASWQTLPLRQTSTNNVAVVDAGVYERGLDKLVRLKYGARYSSAIHVPLTF